MPHSGPYVHGPVAIAGAYSGTTSTCGSETFTLNRANTVLGGKFERNRRVKMRGRHGDCGSNGTHHPPCTGVPPTKRPCGCLSARRPPGMNRLSKGTYTVP